MIELFEKDALRNVRQSSKGNQLKWRFRENWYKADYTGYEGLAEYAVSCLLKESSKRRRSCTESKDSGDAQAGNSCRRAGSS